MPSKGFFAKLTKRRLKRGGFCSISELQAAINRFLAETNSDPRPFRRTDPDKIITAVKRGHQVSDSIHEEPVGVSKSTEEHSNTDHNRVPIILVAPDQRESGARFAAYRNYLCHVWRFFSMTRASGIAARRMKFHQWPAVVENQIWQ
jgi:hypothetical protein